MPKKKVGKPKRLKAGKGKKEGKQEQKSDKESDFEKAKANAALWELRSKVVGQSLAEYRESCRKLARANDDLTRQLHSAERDCIDLAGYLKKQDAAKDDKISMLEKTLKSQEALSHEKQNKMVENYTLEINEMKELFRKRASDFDVIEERMKEIEEFQEMRAKMEQELRNIRKSMAFAEKEHRENLSTMEFKFFKEKAQLEREAEETITMVVKRAHSEAILQLDDAARSVFKENIRLNEALKYHMKEAEDLQKLTDSLVKDSASLALDKNTLEIIAKKTVAQMEAQKKELSHLKVKVAALEQASEVKQQESKKDAALLDNQAELERLQRALATRESELWHIKRLARTIVVQRTELEQFFHEALAQVKEESAMRRQRYKKEELQTYRLRLREATAGKLKFPPIRTFHKSPHSTNSIFTDMEAVTVGKRQPNSKLEISDLSWEQKEQVLRLLFAKMNGQNVRIREQLSPATFVT